MADFLIRAPRAGDGGGLARSWLEAGAYYASLAPELFQVPDPVGLAQRSEGWTLNTPDDTLVLVAETGGQVVGYVSATVHQPPDDTTQAGQWVRDMCLTRLEINALIVQQTFWRQGIGTRLMSAAEEWGRSRGAVIALLDTYIDSPVSVHFYEQRMGYSRRALRFRKTLV